MGAADDPNGQDTRSGSRLGDEGQHFFRNSVIGLLLGKPASKVGSLGLLGRHNADREFGTSLERVMDLEPVVCWLGWHRYFDSARFVLDVGKTFMGHRNEPVPQRIRVGERQA